MPAKTTTKKTKKRNGVTVRRNGETKTLYGAAAQKVLKKRNAAKRRNATGYSADTPIAVTQHYRSGGPGYASKRERIIKAGQRDLFAQDASMGELLGFIRKNPTVVDAVKRKLGAEGFRTASPSLLKRTMREVIRDARQQKRARNPRFLVVGSTRDGRTADLGFLVAENQTKAVARAKALYKQAGYTKFTATQTDKQDFIGGKTLERAKRKAAAKRTRRNPEPGELFEMFTGQEHDSHANVIAPEGAPRDLDEIGDFVEFKWTDNEGRQFTVNLEEQSLAQTLAVHRYADGRDELFLVSAPGQPLAYFGNYLPPGNHGHITEVTYRAQKVHLGDSKPRLYYHKLGEETGQPPVLHINKDGNLIFKGGAYWIEDRGIVN